MTVKQIIDCYNVALATYSQISYPYWKSPLCIENRDDTATLLLFTITINIFL